VNRYKTLTAMLQVPVSPADSIGYSCRPVFSALPSVCRRYGLSPKHLSNS